MNVTRPSSLNSGRSPMSAKPQQQTVALTTDPVEASCRQSCAANIPAPVETCPSLARRQTHGAMAEKRLPSPPASSGTTPDTGHGLPDDTAHYLLTRAAVIRQAAIERAAAGPAGLFGEEGMRIEQLNQRMLGHLCTNTPVDDVTLLLYMISHHVSFELPEQMIQVSDRALGEALQQYGPRLIARTLPLLAEGQLRYLMTSPTLALEALRSCASLFCWAPPEIKTACQLAPLLAGMHQEKRDQLLEEILSHDCHLALSLAPAEELVRIRPFSLMELPQPQDNQALRRIAVSCRPDLLPLLKDGLSDADYEELCDLALSKTGKGLQYIEEAGRTAERVDKAIARPQAPHIADIPRTLYEEKRLQLALKNAESSLYSFRDCQLPCAFLTRWNLWETLKQKNRWLGCIPESERTEALCCEYVAQHPTEAYSQAVPAAIRNRHPEWTQMACQPTCYTRLGSKFQGLAQHLDDDSLAAAVDTSSIILHDLFPLSPAQDIAPWALLLEGLWEQLPQKYKTLIWRKGGTEGLAQAFQAPPLRIDPQALLDPIQERHCSRRAAWLPGEVARQLMFSHHFRLRNKTLGVQLHREMIAGAHALAQACQRRQLRVWHAAPGGGWTHRGGRTLVRTEGPRCVHMKFQRRGEKLDVFSAEQTVQKFAHAHGNTLNWHSEIPEPEEIVLVPLDALPVRQPAFPDRLEIHELRGDSYALAFRFTTRDDSYDTLAWQPDTPQGGCERARQGLLRAFHDLGVWSSLGAVHTSTIALYHHFYEAGDSRPELLLSHLFQPGHAYPGTLHLWNTQATGQSDWGWSGLRDLGDLEFYPFISTFLESSDAFWIPPGYGQRASFVNAIAQNILGGLLHYMRLHRATDPDYHYLHTGAVSALAEFLEQGCDSLLAGLLGDNTRLKDLFDGIGAGVGEIYPEWLDQTAREIIYWSAMQTEQGDCFAQHINRDSRPCAQLYPGHPCQSIRYGQEPGSDYSEAAGESLGTENGKLPLFYLARGLYILAAGLTQRLAHQQ